MLISPSSALGSSGGAITKSLLKCSYPGQIIATRRQTEKIEELRALGATVTSDNKQAVAKSDVILLCVKSTDVETLLKDLAKDLQGKRVISTAATIRLDFFEKRVPTARFVRTMPNIAALVQESFTAYSWGTNVTSKDKNTVKGDPWPYGGISGG